MSVAPNMSNDRHRAPNIADAATAPVAPLVVVRHEDITMYLNNLAQLRKELGEEYNQCKAELADERNALDVDSCNDCQSDTVLAQTMTHLAAELRAVDSALRRIFEGCYGACVECGKSISSRRLRANPVALRCIACQRRFEHRH